MILHCNQELPYIHRIKDLKKDIALKYKVYSIKKVNFLIKNFLVKIKRVSSKSHCKRFLFVKLTWIRLWLLSLLERSFFSWFLLYSILVLKGAFWVSFTKKIVCSDLWKIPVKSTLFYFVLRD